MVLSLFIGIFYHSGIVSGADSQPKERCERIAGTWCTTYSGTSCEGETEEGVLILSIKEDCSFDVKRNTIFPFISNLLFYGKSLDFKNGQIKATIGIRFDNCGEIMLQGGLQKTKDGPQITGTYQYDTQGGGHFRGSLKKE